MMSDEIRKYASQTINEYVDENVEIGKLRMLSEIAAQLAELNEHFRKTDELLTTRVKTLEELNYRLESAVFGVEDRKPDAFGGIGKESVYKEGSPQWLEERKQRKGSS